MVIREYNAQGPLTEMLTGLFAMDNLLCVVVFSATITAIEMIGGSHGTVFDSVFPLICQIVGSAAVGYIIGYLLSIWSPKVIEHGERLILLAGCVLLGVGAAKALGVSAMVRTWQSGRRW